MSIDLLKETLISCNMEYCKKCHKQIGIEDIHWENETTESGTGFYSLEIICSKCKMNLMSVGNYGSLGSNKDEIYEEISKDIETFTLYGRKGFP